jgi:hypothetical protein
MTMSETPGLPLHCAVAGQRCVMTSTTGRLAGGHKTLDAEPPGVRRGVIGRAERLAAAGTALDRRDAVIHGVGVTLASDSPHLVAMFERNWFSPEQWERPREAGPGVTVWALADPDNPEPTAFYSRSRNELWFFNVAFYGQIKSWILGAVGRLLADERGTHSIHGACVEVDGSGLLIIAATGTGKSTSTYGLLERPDARYHSDDWVYVRYGDDGAYGFTSERELYVRTNLVESFPEAALAFLGVDLENVPPLSGELRERLGPRARALAAGLDWRRLPEPGAGDRLWEDLARLLAFDNARAMVDPAALFPGRSVWSPHDGLPLAGVVLLDQDADDSTVLERLDENAFLGRVLAGRTPRGEAQTAFNAYRLVDDAAERAYIERHAADHTTLAAAALGPGAPDTLRTEAELFARLHRAAPTYRINTILNRTAGLSLQEAVRETVDLLTRIAQGTAPSRFDIADVRADQRA